MKNSRRFCDKDTKTRLWRSRKWQEIQFSVWSGSKTDSDIITNQDGLFKGHLNVFTVSFRHIYIKASPDDNTLLGAKTALGVFLGFEGFIHQIKPRKKNIIQGSFLWGLRRRGPPGVDLLKTSLKTSVVHSSLGGSFIVWRWRIHRRLRLPTSSAVTARLSFVFTLTFDGPDRWNSSIRKSVFGFQHSRTNFLSLLCSKQNRIQVFTETSVRPRSGSANGWKCWSWKLNKILARC